MNYRNTRQAVNARLTDQNICTHPCPFFVPVPVLFLSLVAMRQAHKGSSVERSTRSLIKSGVGRPAGSLSSASHRPEHMYAPLPIVLYQYRFSPSLWSSSGKRPTSLSTKSGVQRSSGLKEVQHTPVVTKKRNTQAFDSEQHMYTHPPNKGYR